MGKFQTVEARPGEWEIFSLDEPNKIIHIYRVRDAAIAHVSELNRAAAANNPKTVRELARAYIEAQAASLAAYPASVRLDQPVEDRIDALLTYDALLKKQVAARMALDAAMAAEAVAA